MIISLQLDDGCCVSLTISLWHLFLHFHPPPEADAGNSHRSLSHLKGSRISPANKSRNTTLTFLVKITERQIFDGEIHLKLLVVPGDDVAAAKLTIHIEGTHLSL